MPPRSKKNDSDPVASTVKAVSNAPPSTPSKRVRKPSQKKSASLVASDDDVGVTSEPPSTPSPQKKKSAVKVQKAKVPVSAVTMSDKKFKPKSLTPDYIAISSDGESAGSVEDVPVPEEEDAEDPFSGSEYAESDIVPLAKDDSMYTAATKRSPNVRVGSKRAAPITPPLETRATKSTYKDDRSESPTKRSRVVRSPEIDEVPARDEEEDGEVSDGNNSTGHGPSKLVEITRYYNDREIVVVKKLPFVCYVSNPNNQDAYLMEEGHYAHLPNLRKVNFVPYKPSPSKGLVKFERWALFIPNFPKAAAVKAITFVEDEEYINLSRVNPLNICAIRDPGTFLSPRYTIGVTKPTRVAYCLSAVSTVDSYLLKPHPRIPSLGHGFTATFHSEEFLRLIAVVGMLVDTDTIEAICWSDQFTFGTHQRNEYRQDVSDAGSMDMLLDPSSSPSKSQQGHKPTDIVAPLAFGQTIPIYDARSHFRKFVPSKDTFDNLAVKFPRFREELPRGSFLLVGYLLSVTKVKGQFRVTFYAQWGVLYAIPPKVDYQ